MANHCSTELKHQRSKLDVFLWCPDNCRGRDPLLLRNSRFVSQLPPLYMHTRLHLNSQNICHEHIQLNNKWNLLFYFCIPENNFTLILLWSFLLSLLLLKSSCSNAYLFFQMWRPSQIPFFTLSLRHYVNWSLSSLAKLHPDEVTYSASKVS